MSPSRSEAYVLSDFGSTFTKVALVDSQSGALLARAHAPTTARTDVMDGFEAALEEALSATGRSISLGPRIAASSAGGGLRVAAVGLVADLTAAAARTAALNAGGRVDLVLSGSLGAQDIEALRGVAPDVVLFCGGTDGGQRERVLHNADAVAASGAVADAVVACNRDVAEEVANRFARAGIRANTVENTMPRVGELNIGPARAAILEAFLTHVIHGKRLSSSPEFTDAVLTATPDAVLRGVELLARGTGHNGGIGSVAVIDIGGATTDVHSYDADPGSATGGPASSTRAGRAALAPVPPAVRTVQGDLGMRWSAGGVACADRPWLERQLGAKLEEGVRAREIDSGLLAANERESVFDKTLAVSCAAVAMRRHCGRQYWEFRRNEPPRLNRIGPDLRGVDLVVGTGGVLTLGPAGNAVLQNAMARIGTTEDLMAPVTPRIAIDRQYVLAAAGLLSTRDPKLALSLIKSELRVEN